MKLEYISVKKFGAKFTISFDFDGYIFSIEIKQGIKVSDVARILKHFVKELEDDRG